MISRIAVVSLVALMVFILFAPVLSEAQTGTPHDYSVNFRETGLPEGTQWSVSVQGSTEYSNNSSINFLEPNGTYLFIMGGDNHYRPLPSNFTVNVQGHNSSLVVVWVPVLYPVTFVETGLPVGTFWNVSLGNETNISSNSTISFKVTNGTYDYSIPDVNGIASSTSNGTISVNGAPTKVFIAFTAPVNFTFFENGLPAGAKWSIYINGLYYNSTSSIISVTLPNGTYSFAVILPSGFYATPAQGNVNWMNNIVLIKASSPLFYEIIVAVLVVLISVLLIIYTRIRRRTKQSVNTGDKSEKK